MRKRRDEAYSFRNSRKFKAFLFPRRRENSPARYHEWSTQWKLLICFISMLRILPREWLANILIWNILLDVVMGVWSKKIEIFDKARSISDDEDELIRKLLFKDAEKVKYSFYLVFPWFHNHCMTSSVSSVHNWFWLEFQYRWCVQKISQELSFVY